MALELAGRRRDDSWRRFETPASLLNDEFDLPIRPLLEKLLCCAVELEGGYSWRLDENIVIYLSLPFVVVLILCQFNSQVGPRD